MTRTHTRFLAAAALISFAACNNATSPADEMELTDVTFLSTPAGFADVSSTFAPDGEHPGAFMPGMERGPRLAGPHGPGRGFGMAGGPGDGVMGGGLHHAFIGGVPFGRGPRNGPFGDNTNTASCSYSEATGDVTCTHSRAGLTITRILTWKTIDGTAQARPDDNTHSGRTRVTVAGTITKPHGTSTLAHESDRLVTGLEVGSTSRTVNGTSAGSENTTGTNREGAEFTAVRTVGDTVVGLVIPLEEGRPTYPTAGTITRSMSGTITVNGTTTTRSRREVITFDGSATATIVITVNGESKTCQLPLPRGRMVCSE